MFGYYLFLAWKSIRRTPGNSAIIFAAMTLGVAVATMFSAIYHVYARDPIPEKSAVLHYVRMDSWDPQKAHREGIPPQITYQDMQRIMKSDIPTRQTGSFPAWLMIAPKSDPERSLADHARVCHADFFPMFKLPFRYGAGWTREADEKAEPVVVISDSLNQKFFGGENSVGQVVTIEDHEFRVIGVLAPWHPPIRYYDSRVFVATYPEQFYLPMSQIEKLNIFPNGPRESWWPPGPGLAGLLTGEAAFIHMWVELAEADKVVAYRSFLDAYALEQRKSGRFLRPINNRVTPLLELLRERKCPPPEATTMMIAANLFLVTCALSLMGLFWARFLARSAETGVRRALGAHRWDIFVQHIVECEIVALGSGIMGGILAAISLSVVDLWYKTIDLGQLYEMFRMDWQMAGFALAAALVAGLFAGGYPAYRACRIAPASHLKLS